MIADNYYTASTFLSTAVSEFFANGVNPVVQIINFLKPFADVAAGLKNIFGAF